MVVLVVSWLANEGQEKEAADIFRTLTAESRKEPGCAMYLVHQHRDNSRKFLVYEQYRDDAALEAHRATEHFQKLARGKLPEVGVRVEGDLYSPVE